VKSALDTAVACSVLAHEQDGLPVPQAPLGRVHHLACAHAFRFEQPDRQCRPSDDRGVPSRAGRGFRLGVNACQLAIVVSPLPMAALREMVSFRRNDCRSGKGTTRSIAGGPASIVRDAATGISDATESTRSDTSV
jgi:hypothetical protein